MKRLFKISSVFLIALMAILTLGSCNLKQKFKGEILHEDSVLIKKTLAEVDNPTFESVEDVMAYQRSENQWRKQDSAFFAIPEKILPDIVSVLQKNHDPITKMSIAAEFENNKRIYLNLPDVSETRPIPDVPNTKTIDTIMNGKHVKIIESASPSINIRVTKTEE